MAHAAGHVSFHRVRYALMGPVMVFFAFVVVLAMLVRLGGDQQSGFRKLEKELQALRKEWRTLQQRLPPSDARPAETAEPVKDSLSASLAEGVRALAAIQAADVFVASRRSTPPYDTVPSRGS